MKFFRCPDTDMVFGYESDGSQDFVIPKNYLKLSPLEEAEHKNNAQPTVSARDVWKIERAKLVDAIVVTTTSGNTFDGDEMSQGRMARAILALKGDAKVVWVLADNTPVEVTSTELTEALALAGAAQAAVWVLPKMAGQ